MPDGDYAFEAVDCAGTQQDGRKSVDKLPQKKFVVGTPAAAETVKARQRLTEALRAHGIRVFRRHSGIYCLSGSIRLP